MMGICDGEEQEYMDIKDLLLKSGLFAGITPSELDKVILTLEKIIIQEGEIFIRKGDAADALYIIESGVCQVFNYDESGNEIILVRLELGNFFGEQAVLNQAPGRRNANVRAICETHLIKIPHASFQAVLARDTKLKAQLEQFGQDQLQNHFIMGNLHRVYSSRKRGEISQYSGKFLDQPAIISKFQLKDNREIFAARVVDKNIYSVLDTTAKLTETVIFDTKDIRRELALENCILTGVTSYGIWEGLPQVINMIFNQTPLDVTQLENFKASGEISVVVSPDAPFVKSDDEIICNCMFISLGQIKQEVKAGATNVDAIGDATGAGTVCGTCRVTIQDLLGVASWQPVRIKKVIPLTSYIHAYQIIPALGETLPSCKAGQFIVIQCQIEGNWVSRSYTLTSTPGNTEYYEIAVQREDGGLFSNWLFNHESVIPLLRVSKPDGTFTPNFSAGNPIICLMAGIGITPAVAFARAAMEVNSLRPIYIYYSAHTELDFAYLEELKKITENYSSIKLITRATKSEGRFLESHLVEIHNKFNNAEYFICGPNAFETSMQGYLKNLGIADNRIFIEKFTHSRDPA